ncbi:MULTISPECIES: hypothetical protein [Curtobacterium]|jgi:hypothetical protein|uniref:Uncharacterized protein n=1 Tax=Curtobacterium flaccumfaciens pv. flaccumfaciens TaxID=138532 RepID=A0A9Q2ZQR4_9MICO|nr:MULTISPECIES: hypothetical protein [Curtobacterium]MBT1543503.1 hypothetical protein [Curtobacterium flaccumfaciens pv. flaccumfaciens]MBT1620967.1 hypothetical protein [Curtobacterium flaccumfaciens pv. poinsettiae]VXB80886.1 conserved hypothetical protein [Curtobacterium sp. 8I-2]
MPQARTTARPGPTRRPRPQLHLVPETSGGLLTLVADDDATGSGCSSCGHAEGAHEHYRPGTDCALCDCPKFRRSR